MVEPSDAKLHNAKILPIPEELTGVGKATDLSDWSDVNEFAMPTSIPFSSTKSQSIAREN